MSLDPSASITTSSTRPVTLADAEASDEQAEFAEQGELVNLDEAFNLPYLDDVYGNYSLPFHDEIWTGSNHDIAEKKAEKARRKAAHDAKKAANDAAKEAADEAAGRSTAAPTSAPTAAPTLAPTLLQQHHQPYCYLPCLKLLRGRLSGRGDRTSLVQCPDAHICAA